MPIDLAVFAGRLQQYREQLEESQEEVSQSTGISINRLRDLEAGAIRPTGDEVLILADHWRCDFQSLLSEGDSPLDETKILYRKYGNAFSKKDRRAVQEFLYFCEIEQFLFKELDQPVQEFKFKPSGRYYKGHGEQAAHALRTFLGISDQGRPEVILDVYSTFRSLGVHVFRRKLENSNISGLFIVHPSAGHCLLVNYDEDVYRQRFTAAHEVAHSIFDASEEVVVSLSSERGDLKEIRANRFASCYLMPPDILKRLPKNPKLWTQSDAIHWANRFKVSCDALGVALREASVVDERTSDRIRSYRVPLKDKVDPELGSTLSGTGLAKKRRLLERGLSDFYAKRCFEAHYRGLISTGRLAEVLFSSEKELHDIAPLYGTQLRYGD
jgi:Zn-dependent peptidase ImmA (M78 family)